MGFGGSNFSVVFESLVSGPAPSGVAINNGILLEDSSFILLEDSSGVLLLES